MGFSPVVRVRFMLDRATPVDTQHCWDEFGSLQTPGQRVELKNNATNGMAKLLDKTSRPESCPHQMTTVTEARTVEPHRPHERWGLIQQSAASRPNHAGPGYLIPVEDEGEYYSQGVAVLDTVCL